jgi:dipeptidase
MGPVHVSTRDSPETACIDMLNGIHRPGLGISDRLDSFQPRVSRAHQTPSHLGSTSTHMTKTKHYWATSVVHKQEADRS